jgi:hypothetical protein
MILILHLHALGVTELGDVKMNPQCDKCKVNLEFVPECPTGWCDEHYQCPKCNGTYNIFEFCELCRMHTFTRGHHVIPKSKGGKETIEICETCESYIHKTWTHNQLRDIYNSVDTILSDEGFQKFLKWRRKQPAETLFRSSRGKHRDKNKYH